MNDIPHYPWNEGDKLFASELNAAIANAMATSGGAGRNIIDVSAIMRGDPNSGMDATPALQQALAIAAITPGSVIYLCPGDWNFRSAVPVGPGTAAAINACFLVPSRTLIRGGGMGQTCLYWNDSLCAFNLFDAVQVTTGSPRTFDIAFEEFTVYGSWDTNGDNVNSPPPATGGYPMLLHNVEKIRFTRVGSRFCRANAIATRYCIDVKTLACDIRYCAHGAIDHVSCSMVTVADCTIMHSDDNCIAVHSVHGEPWGVRKNVIIANNSVFDSIGISCVSPRSVLIANNKLDCIRLEGIALHEFTNDAAFDASAMGTVITNNSITNMIDESTITNPPIRVGNAGITISGNSARKGALPAIPGENVTTTTVVNGTTITAGTIIDDTVYFQSNDANTQVAIAVSRGYVIANNYIGRTMPPCDGTATAVGGTLTAGVPKTYNKYSDYGDTDPVGLGYMFLRKGWIDPGNPAPRPGSIVTPPLTVSALSGNGILLNGGSIRDVLITGNQFFGLDAAVTFLLCQPKDVVIRGNHIVDCGTSYGAIMVNLSATLPANEKLPCRVYIEDNFIDVDPYQRHSNRLPKGQWNPNIAPPLVPAALRVQVGSGVVFRNNTVRNAYVMISNQSSGVFESYGNTLEGYATAADSGLSNAGIGVLPLDGSRFRHIESDPTSAHYGELMSIPLTVSLSMPSTGLYIVGTYVAKSYTGPDPNGAVLRGWVRLTTGSSHVAGVDWSAVYDYSTSNDLTALPVVGASNGVVVGIAFNGPPGAYQFALSDPYPSVVIDPPGTGGTQAVAHINRLACEVASPFTSSSTAIDHNLGSVKVIPNGGVLYAVGETLTAVGGTFTQAVKGTVQAIGILGDVTSFGIIQLGQYSAYPPDPTTWSGSAVGQGFTTHLQLWSTAGNPIVDNGGYYPNGTPNAIITPTNGDRGGRVTVKMGQSFVGSPTGLMLAGNATAPLQAVPLQQLTSAVTGSVVSFNTRTGPVTLTSGDVLAVQPASTITPIMDGTAAIGSNATSWARADHVHPSDLSLVATSGGTLTGGTLAGTTTNSGTIQGGIFNSPLLIGIPTAPTAGAGSNTTQIATTAFAAAVAAATGVQTFNTRSGAVTLSNGDVIAVLPGSSTAPLMNSVAAVGTLGTWAHADHVHASDTSRVAVAGGTLTGGTLAGTTTNSGTITGGTIQSATVNALTGPLPYTRIATDTHFDLNSIPATQPTAYSVVNQTAGTNWPADISQQAALVWTGSNAGLNWANQLLMGPPANATTDAAIWYRNMNGGTWSPWWRLMTAAGGTFTGNATFSSATTHTGAATFNGGVSFGGVAGSTIDLSKHLALFSTTYGANVTSGTLNLVANGAATMQLTGGGAAVNGTLTITGRTSLLGITQTATILGANLGTPAGTGFTQNAAVAGTYANPSYLGINQWNVSSDLGALTGNLLFNTAINYNFGGGAFTGNRGGLLVNMMQTGAAAGTSGGGGIEVIHGQVTVNNTFGGTNTGPGVAGNIFAANLYTIMTGGASNLVGTTGLEIDVEARAGATYQAAFGLTVVASGAHQAAGALGNNVAILVGGGSNSLGFDTAYGVTSWGLTSNGTVFRADAAPDMPAFNINKGFDLRPITFAADIFAASGFAVGPTGRVRVGTGYFDVTATGAALSADGAICTAGTLTAAVATTYPMDANFYFADDPYGGYWRVTFTVGTSSLTGLTLLLAGVVKGTPPANPITLTPRGRLNIFGPGAITANLTWNTAQTTLALQPTTGGKITMPALQASTTFANDAAAATGGVAVGGLYRNGSVIQIRVA